MKYLVNRKTKEHRIVGGPIFPAYAEGCDIVEADDDGWIPFKAANFKYAVIPLPEFQKVEVETISGSNIIINAGKLDWRWIVKYRPILDDKPEQFSATLESAPDLIDRLKSAHQAASELPDIIAELREVLEPMGLGVVYLSQFAESETHVDHFRFHSRPTKEPKP